MDKEEIKSKIESLEKELDLLKVELQKSNLESIIKRLENKKYFYINGFEIANELDCFNTFDSKLFNNFNYFATKEDAKKMKIKQDLFRKILLTRNFVTKKESIGYLEGGVVLPYIFLDEGGRICVDYSKDSHFLQFSNMEQLELFRKYISDDEIKQFLSM